jgi:hypothetical protein
MKPPRITIRIDRVVADRPGLTREALAEALARELRAARGSGEAAFGPARSVERVSGSARDASPGAIARAILGAAGR